MINGGMTASGGRNAQPYVSPTRMDDCNFEERFDAYYRKTMQSS